MQMPPMTTYTVASRSSSTYTRTLTFTTAHTMVVGMAFLVSGVESTYYDTDTNANSAGIAYVTAIPDANSISYYINSQSYTESTTACSGTVLATGWNVLRIGCRMQIPGSADINLSDIAFNFGFGVSRGNYPVSSSLLTGFFGVTDKSGTAGNDVLAYGAGPPPFYSPGSFDFYTKIGPTITYIINTSGYMSADRTGPAIFIVDLYGNSTGIPYAGIYNERTTTSTHAKFLSLLEPTTVYTGSVNIYNHKWIDYANAQSGMWVEVFTRDPAIAPLEVEEIGFALF